MVTGGGGEDLRKLFLSLPLVCRGKKSPPESLLVKVVEMDVLFFLVTRPVRGRGYWAPAATWWWAMTLYLSWLCYFSEQDTSLFSRDWASHWDQNSPHHVQELWSLFVTSLIMTMTLRTRHWAKKPFSCSSHVIFTKVMRSALLLPSILLMWFKRAHRSKESCLRSQSY